MSTPTELVLHEGNNNEFSILANEESRDMFAEMIDMGIKDHQIPIVKIPGSAATTWQVTLASGKEIMSKELDVVIAWASPGHRTYFEASYEESEEGAQPECSSEMDGKGFGSMTADGAKTIRDCAKCPKNKFGSARNGKGRACSEYTFLYCLLPQQMLPIRVRISPGSLESLTTYSIGCMSSGTKASSVITRLTLVEKGTKPRFAMVKFQTVEELSVEQAKTAKEIGDVLKGKMLRRSAEDLKSRYEDKDGDSGEEEGGSVIIDTDVTESGEDPFPQG